MPVEPYRTVQDLPDILAVFPLPGAVLYPRWSLPLNIFEPRYLRMIDDAMSGHRMIGMIQSAETSSAATPPELAKVGCAGRITSYAETDDGRYLISLTGICRFSCVAELPVELPYRQVQPDYRTYAQDLHIPPEPDVPDRETLVQSLQRYTKINAMEVDWDAVRNAPMETLINALSAGCPFGTIEKQALLEAFSVADRAEVLIALLDMDVPGDDSSTLQ